MFMGPETMGKASRHGGQVKEEYPIDDEDYLEGKMKKFWNVNKKEGCTMTFSEVSDFVSGFLLRCC